MRSNEHRPDENGLRPVDFLAVEFPGGRITTPRFEQLLSLADVLTEAEFDQQKARIPNG